MLVACLNVILIVSTLNLHSADANSSLIVVIAVILKYMICIYIAWDLFRSHQWGPRWRQFSTWFGIKMVCLSLHASLCFYFVYFCFCIKYSHSHLQLRTT